MIGRLTSFSLEHINKEKHMQMAAIFPAIVKKRLEDIIHWEKEGVQKHPSGGYLDANTFWHFENWYGVPIFYDFFLE